MRAHRRGRWDEVRAAARGRQRILAAEDDSKWTFFYREYEEDKRERLGKEGARPHRPRYKPPLMH